MLRTHIMSRGTCRWRAGHFCRPPHVAMGVGLYLQPSRSPEVWRIVSEDCNNLDGSSRFISFAVAKHDEDSFFHRSSHHFVLHQDEPDNPNILAVALSC